MMMCPALQHKLPRRFFHLFTYCSPGRPPQLPSARRTRQVTVGDLLCRAAYGSLFLNGLG
jgi:hypothetical protein